MHATIADGKRNLKTALGKSAPKYKETLTYSVWTSLLAFWGRALPNEKPQRFQSLFNQCFHNNPAKLAAGKGYYSRNTLKQNCYFAKNFVDAHARLG